MRNREHRQSRCASRYLVTCVFAIVVCAFLFSPCTAQPAPVSSKQSRTETGSKARRETPRAAADARAENARDARDEPAQETKADDAGAGKDPGVAPQLWIQSTTPFWAKDLFAAGQAFRWVTDVFNWYRAVAAMGTDALKDPLPVAAQALLIGLLFYWRPRMRRWLEATAEKVRSPWHDSFLLTAGGALATLGIAAPWPGVLWFFARRLAPGDPPSEFPAALGAGLGYAALLLLTILLGRVCLRRQGLATVHFRWSAEETQPLRGLLARLAATQVPAAGLVATLQAQSNPAWRDSLGRLVFVVALVTATVLAGRVLHPSRGLMGQWSRTRKNIWLVRTRYVWYPFLIVASLLLVLVALLGYYYTAIELGRRLLATLWFAVALLFFDGLMGRWLFVARRRLALEEYRKRQEAAAREASAQEAAAREAAEGEERKPVEGGSSEPMAEPEIDIPLISTQARRLMHVLNVLALAVGLWLIWVDFFPALRVLDEKTAWESRQAGPTTYADLLLAVLVLVATLKAGRNIPGLLEIGVLGRLPLEPGVGYAITTLSRYTILAVGFVSVFMLVGVVWDQVQWLVAALGVGLGFGLQEIFANFVSGLIMLFERPVRVGDTVTLGNVTGMVTRIRMRATTIVDWDRKELIVPNKEFITGQLVNWTLSDTILRVVVSVGIAYGSDVALARKLLLKVARENPTILEDPEPSAIFVRFGDSALDFELRAFIPNSRAYLTIRDELNSAIDEEFRKANIEIAFPQHDVHIRSIQADLPIVRKRASAGLHTPGPPAARKADSRSEGPGSDSARRGGTGAPELQDGDD